jgi:hypothetical protein
MDSASNKVGFFNYVFKFDDDSKSEILNILQYAFLSLIPVVILNKSMQTYVPEADDKKGSLELSAEIIIQTIVMFLGLLLINRIVTYVPTYSGVDYPEFSIHYIILAILMITLSLQTKIGEKVSILSERVYELWNGKSDKKKTTGKQGSNSVKVSQPISGQQQQYSQQQMQMSSQAPIDRSASMSMSTSINSLPSTTDQALMSPEQLPNYNNMYQNTSTPLINAASPGVQENFMEPMAANSVLGGNGFGSW